MNIYWADIVWEEDILTQHSHNFSPSHAKEFIRWIKAALINNSMNKNKKTERKKTTQNHALAFSETRGPAVPQCCLLQAAGSTGCGVRGTAQADRGVWGPEISQGPESSGEQILCAYPPKATQQPCDLLQSFHFCSMVWDSLKASKLVYFQTICQYKKHRMGFWVCLSETVDIYIYGQHQICVGTFSKHTQLSLLEQPCPRSDSNAVENNSYKV